MQRAPLEARVDPASSEAQGAQLSPPDDSVLLLRQPRDPPIHSTSATFFICEMKNGALAGHAADGAGAVRAHGARFVPKPSRTTKKRFQPAGTASGFDPLK
jgi:hypothetical protein